MAKTKGTSCEHSPPTIGFEAKLWLAADKLRNTMDAVEYKHVVLGLIFLKDISTPVDNIELNRRIDATVRRHMLIPPSPKWPPLDDWEYRVEQIKMGRKSRSVVLRWKGTLHARWSSLGDHPKCY